jgi:hypothetical protein
MLMFSIKIKIKNKDNRLLYYKGIEDTFNSG